jgi:hypothetical protein
VLRLPNKSRKRLSSSKLGRRRPLGGISLLSELLAMFLQPQVLFSRRPDHQAAVSKAAGLFFLFAKSIHRLDAGLPGVGQVTFDLGALIPGYKTFFGWISAYASAIVCESVSFLRRFIKNR